MTKFLDRGTVILEKDPKELYYNEFPYHLIVYHNIFAPELLTELANASSSLLWFYEHYDREDLKKPTGAVFSLDSLKSKSKQVDYLKSAEEKFPQFKDFLLMLTEIDHMILEILTSDFPNFPINKNNYKENLIQNLINWFQSHENPILHTDGGILSTLTPYVVDRVDFDLYNSRGETEFLMPNKTHMVGTLPRNGDIVVFSGQIQHRGNGCIDNIRRYSYVSTYAHPKDAKNIKK